jgi:hypothetical protein
MKIHPFIRTAISLVLVCGIAIWASPSLGDQDKMPTPGSDAFAVHVMEKIDDQHRGAQSHGVMEMEVKTKHWTRSITMESWSLGKDYSLVRILKPKKEKGTATLKAKNDLFTYLAKTSRTIKISSGMMGGSWMGSHFTNDDLVKHSRLSEDFVIKTTFTGKEGQDEIYRFTLTPRPDAAIVWGKIVVTVRQADLAALTQDYYDEDGKKVRSMAFSNHQNVDGRLIPLEMIMKPLDGSGEYTKISWKKIDFDVSLKKSFFSIQKLKSL